MGLKQVGRGLGYAAHTRMDRFPRSRITLRRCLVVSVARERPSLMFSAATGGLRLHISTILNVTTISGSGAVASAGDRVPQQ